MAFLGRNTLGIALGSRSIQAVEIGAKNGGFQVIRSAELQLGDADSLQDAAALGQKLAQFLKQHEFSASQAVFGLPAQWLMLKEKMMPPAASEVMNSMLLIQAEHDFSLEPAALTLDYIAGQTTPDGQAVLLFAAMRERIEQIQMLAQSAGLKPQVITPTTLALATASEADDVLYFGENGTELATFGHDGLPRLRHITAGSVVKNRGGQSQAMQLGGELRRAFALSHRGGGSGDLMVWDDVGIKPALLHELATETKIAIKRGERFQVATVEGLGSTRAAAGAALALCQFRPELAAVDLLHSRLAVKPPPKFSSRVIWGTVAALVLLAVIGDTLVKWRQDAMEVAELRQKRDDTKESVEAAKAFVARVSATRTWYETRPNYLECLRAVTLCFPEEGRAWASSVSLREDMRGILMARAADEKSVLDVLDRLKASRTLTNVKMLHMRGTGAKSTEISFGISFLFRGAEQP